MSTVPCPFSLQHRNLRFPIWRYPGQRTMAFGSWIPSSSAAIATRGLTVEPGAYVPCSPLFCIGLRTSVARACHSFFRIPLEKTFGSNPGAETKARMSPVFGTIAITAPARFSIASSATFWMSASRVVWTIPPERGGTSSTSRLSLPAASTSTCRPPLIPRRTSSIPRSSPYFPTMSPIASHSSSDWSSSSRLTSPTYPKTWAKEVP